MNSFGLMPYSPFSHGKSLFVGQGTLLSDNKGQKD